jgi:hypothetical protein
MKSNYRIAIIICYFGKFPWYFTYFLHSCKYNQDVDFFVITDNSIKFGDEFSNIFFIQKNISEIKVIASAKLGFEVIIPTPFKLCDFRPAFGLFFSDLISEYDFWGYCDIDIIYGNIRNFLTEEVLTKYDVISVRPEYTTGFFCLYKNTPKINALFKYSKDYKKAFLQEDYVGFDECAQLCFELIEGQSVFDLDSPIESMTHIVRKLNQEKLIKAYFDLHVVEGCPGNIKWSKGILSYKDEFEILLYHLMWLKDNPALEIPQWSIIPDIFFINENSFSKGDRRFEYK